MLITLLFWAHNDQGFLIPNNKQWIPTSCCSSKYIFDYNKINRNNFICSKYIFAHAVRKSSMQSEHYFFLSNQNFSISLSIGIEIKQPRRTVISARLVRRAEPCCLRHKTRSPSIVTDSWQQALLGQNITASFH